jgi:hypothetical protein
LFINKSREIIILWQIKVYIYSLVKKKENITRLRDKGWQTINLFLKVRVAVICIHRDSKVVLYIWRVAAASFQHYLVPSLYEPKFWGETIVLRKTLPEPEFGKYNPNGNVTHFLFFLFTLNLLLSLRENRFQHIGGSNARLRPYLHESTLIQA